MGSTNYTATFIQVATDCPAAIGEIPPDRASGPTVARLHYDIVATHPYELTSDDLLFAVYAERQGITKAELDGERTAFFARSQACLRSSPLAKRYGWGIHHDAASRIALVAVNSDEYRRLAAAPEIAQVRAMRSTRA